MKRIRTRTEKVQKETREEEEKGRLAEIDVESFPACNATLLFVAYYTQGRTCLNVDRERHHIV